MQKKNYPPPQELQKVNTDSQDLELNHHGCVLNWNIF